MIKCRDFAVFSSFLADFIKEKGGNDLKNYCFAKNHFDSIH